MTELIICEKPKAAQKVAEALSDGKLIKKSEKGVPYYEIKHKKKNIIVASVVGHIYGLTEKKGHKWTYPTFDVEWKPISEINKKGDFSKKYLDVIKKLSPKTDEFTIACDYDVEGEVIGLNILRFGCKQKDANRMKFSTLTKPDLVEAYAHKSKHLDWGQAEAGLARHELDWYWGINTSRALTSAIKKAGMWHIMSTGRVQGPALKIIVDKEREIKRFKPEPYWQIELLGNVKKGPIDAWHIKDKFFEKKEADEVMKKTKGHKANVSKIDKNEFEQKPPYPFDLTTLQTEAYRCFRIKPKDTLSIGQDLYTDGLISYPRTSSQELPPNIGYKKILTELSRQAKYEKHCKELLSKDKLQPNNGKKTDPAHPAIYPTGQKAKLDGREEKIYDLIVKRFMATFAEPAKRETITITIDVNKEKFIEKGSRTTKKGWHEFYGSYVPVKEEEVPDVHEGEEVHVKEIKLHAKETTPPPRYTQASIIKELEKKNLGTKSTRAAIVDTLYQRNYVTGESIEATDLGISTVETLEKYSPEIIDEELTKHFEDEMEEIRDKKKKREEILEEAKKELTKTLKKFKEKEKSIGESLQEATKETRNEMNTIGKCPNCEGTLMIRFGKFGRFVACNKYPDCKTTFKLPAGGLVKKTEKICEQCKNPIIMVIRKGKRPQETCINIDCPSKKMSKEEKKEADKIEGKKCRKCGKGKMVLRKGVYGSFMACDQYPKCRNIERLENGNGSYRKKEPEKKEEEK